MGDYQGRTRLRKKDGFWVHFQSFLCIEFRFGREYEFYVTLAIISYINYCDGTPPEFLPPPKKTVAPPPAPPARTVHQNDAYVDDDILMPEEEDVFSPTKPVLSIAPDRHDIYHIKIPTGESNSKRAKNVLEVHNNLREQRVIKRGVTGVRRSGMELHSVSSHSKPIQKQTPLKPKPTVALVVQVFFFWKSSE
uniref:Uncharacterized protein n=1 Tax=Meloidogyne enterolobii TaxID=390850 RepID=A0A6V7WMV6_MELEN|nr:unnamed protein product [Meloidogyne enterolobii]